MAHYTDKPPAYTAGPNPPPGAYDGYQAGAPPTYPGGAPPGYHPVQHPPTSYSQTTVTVQPVPQATRVVVVGGCPACRVGVLEDDFTCLGVCCAIIFFPIGILCCLAMRQRRCPNCGAVFG
ncbi:membrane protein BRI3-like [Saccoglossus kowalevskii]|uniref:Membrane protein BRI3 n=1 Tax=Saccoglossus kowalevskii TaxID=10224 RepID=A0ABM0GJB4_SACKO|nr:PREDICTED: brain protein I3-like [Saccoglossus kowalevskii]